MKRVIPVIAWMAAVALAGCGSSSGGSGSGGGTPPADEGSVASPLALTSGSPHFGFAHTSSYYSVVVAGTNHAASVVPSNATDVALYVYSNAGFSSSVTILVGGNNLGGPSVTESIGWTGAAGTYYIQVTDLSTAQATFVIDAQ
jgi:hypothetical protein